MVTGYSFPFHMHILCIQYGTVLANTAVLCMCVCIGYHLFAGMWHLLVSTYITLYYAAKIIFNRRVWYRVLSLH